MASLYSETESYFDKFFDCLNVRSFSEWKASRKPDRKPYTSPDDPRLEVHSLYTFLVCILVYKGV